MSDTERFRLINELIRVMDNYPLHDKDQDIDLHLISKSKLAHARPTILRVASSLGNSFEDTDFSLFNHNIKTLDFNNASLYAANLNLFTPRVTGRYNPLTNHLQLIKDADACVVGRELLHIASSKHFESSEFRICTSGFSLSFVDNEDPSSTLTYGTGLNELYINYLLTKKMGGPCNNELVGNLMAKFDHLIQITNQLFFESKPIELSLSLLDYLDYEQLMEMYQAFDRLFEYTNQPQTADCENKIKQVVFYLEILLGYIRYQEPKSTYVTHLQRRIRQVIL